MNFIYRKNYSLILIIIFSFFFQDCNRHNEDLTPSYISIEGIELVANPLLHGQEGSLSNGILDAWVYIDDQFLGAYELPVTFPVLLEGIHTVRIKAGIKINGISEVRGEYPFYEAWQANVMLVKDSIVEIHPIVQYKDFTVFDWIEDFETGQSTLEKSSRSDTIVMVTGDPGLVFEGAHSGAIYLTELRYFFEALTVDAYVLPKTGEDIYIEMNFKTNNSALIGLFANFFSQSVQSSVLILNKTDEWKKIYINLLNAVNANYSAIDYNVFIVAEKDDDVDNPQILIDNIKLVH